MDRENKALESGIEATRPPQQRTITVRRVAQCGVSVAIAAQHSRRRAIFVDDELGAGYQVLLRESSQRNVEMRSGVTQRAEVELDIEQPRPKHNPFVDIADLAQVDDARLELGGNLPM